MDAPPLNETTIEKGVAPNLSHSPDTARIVHGDQEKSPPSGFFARLNARVESLAHLEQRGIERVLPQERYPASNTGYAQMALLWFSTNLTANNLTLAMLGPLVYSLSFTDAALCAVFGGTLGAIGASYMSTFGPRSGNRTMVVARYFMGYYPSKICCLLNIVIMLGYGMIDCLVGGQILSAVSDGSVSVVVGIIINAVITVSWSPSFAPRQHLLIHQQWVVATFGMSVFHLYERYEHVPPLLPDLY